MSSLAHHGVKGQKWGVRRFQNPDGTRTALGKKQLKAIRLSRNEEGIRQVYRSLSDRDLNLLGYEKEEIEANRKDDFKDLGRRHTDYDQYNRVRYKNGDAVGYIAATGYQTAVGRGRKIVNILAIDLAVNSNYRGQGHSVELGKDIVRWFDRYGSKEYDRMEWYAKAENIASQKAAERSGFERRSKKEAAQGWVKYSYKGKNIKHSSIGGNMNYIYGNTLVLGDSSYLEHHGIKNQKWGVRRFQNPDGSLTAAGRIRYGVTGAAKAAFKVGKKLGAATASAARAGVKKAQDNAYAKKKEKASQTREGVLKNKKMFTSDELKALENRFKIEDEMSEASLRHGQAVARTVSQYANTTRDVLSALQTGGNAVSAITKAFADIQSYQNAKGVTEAAKEKGMTTKEFDLFLKEKYPNAKKDDGSKKKGKNNNKAEHLDPDDGDDDNPPNNGGGGGSKKQAEYAANRRKAQEAIYAKRKADLDSRESGVKQREDYLNKRLDALVKVSKQRQSEQDAREADLNRRNKAASEREAKLKETAKTAADVMSKLNKRQADLDKKESFLNSIESYRLDTLSEFKKNEEEAARRKKKNARHSAIGEEMYADYLEHHGIKGQKWGVRRFQNADGSLTDKGRKHYQKKLALEERKLTAANASRGQYERVRTPMSVGMGILGAVAGAMVGVPAGPAGIAAGAAIVSSIAASSTYAEYTLKGVFAGHGANRSKKKIAKYKEALAQDAFEIQNGVLIYGSGQSGELKHFGLKGMKWGVRRFQNKDGSLTEAGKQRYSNTGELDGGGGGGGADEEDEETKKKIEEAAKKAGMTVAEYRKKFPDKIAAMKEKDRSWKYDSSISTKDMQRMAKEGAEFTESVSKEAHEAAMAQNSALRAGNKKRASTHGWAATQYNTLAKNEQTGGRYSAKNVKRNYDSTLEGKATKLRYATQRAKQRVYNAAGGKYKEEANTARVYREREKAKENRAIKNGNQYDAEAARSWQDLYSQSEKAMNSAYRKSIAGRYDALKAKRKKRYAKHSAFVKDGTLFLEYRGTNFPKR